MGLTVGLTANLVSAQGELTFRLPTIEGDRTLGAPELIGTKVLLIEFASW